MRMPEVAALVVLVLVGLLVVLASQIRLKSSRRKSRSGRPRQSRLPWRSTWGTVYVHQFKDQPYRYKVGLTKGLARTRKTGIRSKVKAVTGEVIELRQVFAVDMNHARRVEKLVLKALEPHRAPIGTMTEFFDFPQDVDPDLVIDHIAFIVRSCAQQVRRDAIDRGRWDDEMEIKARLVRLTPEGHLIHRSLFIDPSTTLNANQKV